MTVASAGSTAASRLYALAPRCRRGKQLSDLAQALRDYHAVPADVSAARGWASVDLFTAFLSEDPGLAEPEGTAKRWGLIDGSVQMLVFVPILLTWAGLASAAFGARAGESMLQAWEAGRVPGLALRDVALYTAAIVAALIGLTTALAARRWRLERADTQLRQALAEALTMADLELSPLRLGITRRIAKELDKAADKLAEAARAMETVSQAATTAVTATIPALADVETAAKASRDAAVQLGTVPDRLTKHLDQITAVVGEVAQADRDLVTSMDSAAKQLADSVASSTSDLATSSGNLAAATATSGARIAGALDSGAGDLRDALSDVSVAAAGYASRTEVAADIIGQTHQALAALPTAVQGLHDGVSGIGGQLAELTTAITAAKDAAALLLEAAFTLRDQPPPPPAPERGSRRPGRRANLYSSVEPRSSD